MESPLTTLGVRSEGQPTCAVGLLAFFWIKDCRSLSASGAGGPTGGMAIFFGGLTPARSVWRKRPAQTNVTLPTSIVAAQKVVCSGVLASSTTGAYWTRPVFAGFCPEAPHK